MNDFDNSIESVRNWIEFIRNQLRISLEDAKKNHDIDYTSF